MKYKYEIKNTWEITKELSFQRRILSMEKTFKENSKRVNKIFLKIDPKLREKMQPSKYFSESYTDAINIKIPEQTVLINELKQVFFSLKSNKNPGDQ